MNRNLTQLGSQLLEIWRHLGTNQRITVGMAATAVLAALMFLAFWSSSVDYGLLYGKLDDAEAAKVIAYLDEGSIPYKVGQSGGAIFVPRDKVYESRMQLATRGIPRGDGVGFEIFDKSNFGISEFAQRTNFKRALQGELARTIGQLDEVESARVMLVMPENRLLINSHRKPTASVFVKVRGHNPLDNSSINSIRFLVANSVEGLQVGNVSVVDNRGNVLSQNSEEDSLTGLSASQLVARRDLEQYLAKKAQGMLETVLGPGQAVVRVAADINLDSIILTEEKYDPDGQVIKSTTTEDEDISTTTDSGSGGVPGISSNLGFNTNSYSTATPNITKTKKKTSQEDYEVSRTISNTTQLAGGIKKLTAAVFIASRFEGTGADRKAVPRTPEELEKLRRIVQSALGIDSVNNGPVGQDLVTLEEMPFNDSLGLLTEELSTESSRDFYLNLAQKFLYPGLAVMVFGIFLFLLKKTPAQEFVMPTPSHDSVSRTGTYRNGGRGPASVPQPGHPRQAEPTLATVEVFNRLIKENPDNMSQAIQSWLGRGNSN